MKNEFSFSTANFFSDESIPAPMLAASRACVLQCLTRLVGAQHHADRQTLYDLACEAQLAQVQAENPDLPPHMCEDCMQHSGFTAALDETLNRLPDLCQEAGFDMRAPTPTEQLLYGLQPDDPCCFAKSETQAEPQPEPSVEKVTMDCRGLEALYTVSRPLGKEPQQPDQWPELDEGCLPAFPVELLPAPYGEFAVQVAASVHAPVDFAAAALLGTVSSALTGRVFVEIKKHFVKPVQQYLGLIGFSGSGKSPVMNIMADPLRDCLHALREADAILREEFEKNGLAGKVWQYFVAVPDFTSVGVRNDQRYMGWPAIIRAVNTTDAMTATIEEIPYALLHHITDRINRVCLDLTPKPIGTIEWE